MAIPEESEKAPSVTPSVTPSVAPPPSNRSKVSSRISKVPSQTNGKAPSTPVPEKAPSAVSSRHSQQPPPAPSADGADERDGDRTPRPASPNDLDQEEARIVRDALAGRTPRTSYYAASLEPEVASHYHDMELCVLLHQEGDPNGHEFVKKALRKAIRQRVKRLGMKYDTEVCVACAFILSFSFTDVVRDISLSKSTRSHITIMTPAFICIQTMCQR